MKRPCSLVLVLFCLSHFPVTAAAVETSILDTGPPQSAGQLGIVDVQFAAFSFTLMQDFFDVSLSPYLAGPSSTNVTAWLTTAIGPTASSSDLISSNTTFYQSQTFVPQAVFSGLDLSAGTYFLVLSSTASSAENGHLGVFCADVPENLGVCGNPVPVPGGISLVSLANDGRGLGTQNPSVPYASTFESDTISEGLLFPAIRITGSTAPVPGTVTIDFDALEQPGSLAFEVPSPYLEDGFSIAEIPPNIWGRSPLESFQQSHVAYAGSAGLNLAFSRAGATLTRIDGGAFSLTSIDLSTFDNPSAQPEFTGVLSSGGTVQQTFQVSQFGFQTFSFSSSFSDVTSVSWIQGDGGPNAYQIDNIVTSAPVRPVPLDITPRKCPNRLNVKSNGPLQVAILGSSDFDVTEVDPASVRLEEVAPRRSNIDDVSTPFPFPEHEGCNDCSDLGDDGFDDLIFRFNTQEIVAALGFVEDGDCLILKLTGNLKDGSGIEGEDVVVIRDPGTK